MKSVPLHDTTHFELIPGLWKGEREPLNSAKVLRGTNFAGDGLLDFDDVVQLEVEERHFESRRLQPGDIIVERSGGGPKQPVGRVALFDPPDSSAYFCSNFTTAIRVRDRSIFDPAYVALYLHGLYLQGATETLQRATTGIRNLDWQAYLRFEVPVLALGQQRLLVRLIGGVRAAYRNEQQLVRTLTELKRAAMRELFTRGLRGEPQKDTEIGPVPESWQIKAIGHVFEIVQGLSLKGNLSGGSDGVPFLRTSNVYWGRIDLKNVSRMHVAPELIGDRWLRLGDLLVCEGGEIGRAAVWESKEPGYTYQNHLHRLRPLIGGSIEPKFAAAWLEVGFCHRKVYEGAGNKTTIPNLSRARLAELPMPVPAIDEQRDIVAILDAIDRKIELHRKKRTVLEELFKALLHKLMTGEIRVDELDLSALQAHAEPLSPAAEPAV